ncbi:MAG: histidinol dehydrogenase, partial [Gammaproteobacteria bacterium]|nr:histidinol dehydrogenase [Gammaproteobacteria bacterium]
MSSPVWERLDWSRLDAAARATALCRPALQVAERTRAQVAAILDCVRAGGDGALRELGLRFDGAELADLAVSTQEFAMAAGVVPATLRTAIEQAARRIEAYHRAGMQQPYALDTADGVRCERILRPIRSVGLYVP